MQANLAEHKRRLEGQIDKASGQESFTPSEFVTLLKQLCNFMEIDYKISGWGQSDARAQRAKDVASHAASRVQLGSGDEFPANCSRILEALKPFQEAVNSTCINTGIFDAVRSLVHAKVRETLVNFEVKDFKKALEDLEADLRDEVLYELAESYHQFPEEHQMVLREALIETMLWRLRNEGSDWLRKWNAGDLYRLPNDKDELKQLVAFGSLLLKQLFASWPEERYSLAPVFYTLSFLRGFLQSDENGGALPTPDLLTSERLMSLILTSFKIRHSPKPSRDLIISARLGDDTLATYLRAAISAPPKNSRVRDAAGALDLEKLAEVALGAFLCDFHGAELREVEGRFTAILAKEQVFPKYRSKCSYQGKSNNEQLEISWGPSEADSAGERRSQLVMEYVSGEKKLIFGVLYMGSYSDITLCLYKDDKIELVIPDVEGANLYKVVRDRGETGIIQERDISKLPHDEFYKFCHQQLGELLVMIRGMHKFVEGLSFPPAASGDGANGSGTNA